MSTTSMLKAEGLQTFNNYLGQIPEGSLFQAENVVIDKDGIIEPRRGIKVLADIPSTAKQLLTYKNNILAHYGDTLSFYNGTNFTPYKKRSDFQPSDVDTTANTIQILVHGIQSGDSIVFSSTGTLPAPLVSGTTYYVLNPTQNTFQLTTTATSLVPIDITTQGSGVHTASYDYVIGNVDSSIRIKGVELNGNFYVTSANGIKKLSGLNEYYVQDAGGVKALDISLKIDFNSTSGFLLPSNEVAYRVLWVSTDINNNLTLGAPSYRSVIVNPSVYESRNVIITSAIPSEVTTDFYYRVYRTSQSPNAGGSGDEQKLVYEAKVTEAEITSGSIVVTDEQPEELRDTGANLYTNEFSGEGILQTNEKPPIAKDVAIYKNIVFYANTTTNFKSTFNLLGQDGLVQLPQGSISSVVFGAGITTFTYPDGHGLSASQDIVLQGTAVSGKDGVFAATRIDANQFSLVGDFSAINLSQTSTFTSYITITKGIVTNKYYFVGRRTADNITFTGSGGAIAGTYFEVNSFDDITPYYVWLNDTTATTEDPSIANKIGIKVDFLPTDTSAQIVQKIITAMNATGDFEVSDSIGEYNATTNTPTLVNGTGTKGQIYQVTVPGTQDFGAGNITFAVDDYVRYNGTSWVKLTTSENLIIQTSNSGFSAAIAYGPSFPYDATASYRIQEGFGENTATNFVRLSSLASPASRIEDTAKSLVYVINQNDNDVVNAYYTSSANDLPGSMLLEAKLIDNVAFALQAVNSVTGAMFNPNLTSTFTSANETFPNRIYFSKTSQPDSVPAVNNIDVGPKDKAILRILGLRDSLFILKEEGLYRLTGESINNFSVALFDNSANLVAPDTAAILNNQIYALTSQGVATITETGVGIISRPIENIFNKVSSPSFTNFKTASFGFGYEADRCYLIFTLDKATDTVATVAYRYNTFTQCWTSWKKSATCGIVETNENKLYIGASDITAVEVERKTLTTRDYADRQYNRSLTMSSFGLILDNVTNIVAGDLIEQVQYLKPSDYNRLVKKAKTDPYLLLSPTFPEITTTGSNLRLAMENLATALTAADTSLYSGTFNGATDVNLAANTITINSHGLVNGNVVKFTNGVLPVPLQFDTLYAVVNTTTNTFQVSEEIGGSPIDLVAFGSGTITVKDNYLYSVVEDFEQQQLDFNFNIAKLNTSTGVFFTDYKTSTGTVNIDTLVDSVNYGLSKIQTVYNPILFQGPLVHFKSIQSSVIWAPISLGEPSILKQVRSGTFLLENDVLAGATVGYASDLSGNFENEGIGIDQDGNWGEGIWGNFTWGGEGTSVPIRTLIPRQKQRCRYIKARFFHNNAFNRFAILGISYTYEMGSDRGYR